MGAKKRKRIGRGRQFLYEAGSAQPAQSAAPAEFLPALILPADLMNAACMERGGEGLCAAFWQHRVRG